MIRDFSSLERGEFDVLVIGGGIYGAWTAYDAALRGLNVAIVEKSDWASGTSSASTKLIHGGLRYLEQIRLGLVRKSLQERKLLASLAPHRVTPQRFVVPLYHGSRPGALRLQAGLSLYDLIAGPHQPVADHESLAGDEVLAACPFLRRDGLQGGFSYGDCRTDDARFTLEIVAGAALAGAAAVNYAEVVELLLGGGRVHGAVVRDRLSSRSVEVKASVVVNACGAWAPELSPRQAKPVPIRLTKGIHLVLPALETEHAALLTTRCDGRVFFMIPWYGKTLVGTTDTDYTGDPEKIEVEPKDIDYLLSEANRFLQDAAWDESHVCGSFAGLRALRDDHNTKDAWLVTREWRLEETLERYLLSVGGKFTTARLEAAQIVDRVLNILNRSAGGRPPTGTRPFPWSPAETFADWQLRSILDGLKCGFDEETARSMTHRYGTRTERVVAGAVQDAALSRRIVPDLPFSCAEIAYAAEQEMVVTLEDLVRRRIPLSILHPLANDTLERIAAIAAAGLGWSADEQTRQVRSLAGRTP